MFLFITKTVPGSVFPTCLTSIFSVRGVNDNCLLFSLLNRSFRISVSSVGDSSAAGDVAINLQRAPPPAPGRRRTSLPTAVAMASRSSQGSSASRSFSSLFPRKRGTRGGGSVGLISSGPDARSAPSHAGAHARLSLDGSPLAALRVLSLARGRPAALRSRRSVYWTEESHRRLCLTRVPDSRQKKIRGGLFALRL